MKDLLLDIEGHGIPTEMYAYISIDKNGKSGICATVTPLGLTPMVGMTRKDLNKFKSLANAINNEAKASVVPVKFQNGVILTDEDDKPKFTKEMEKRKVLPPVGSECLIMFSFGNHRVKITYISEQVGCYTMPYDSNNLNKEFTFDTKSVSFLSIEDK